jgi:hypothetical protein
MVLFETVFDFFFVNFIDLSVLVLLLFSAKITKYYEKLVIRLRKQNFEQHFISLSLHQNRCKLPFTVVQTDIQKLKFSALDTQLIFEF